MTEIGVRDAVTADLASIAAVALATGQDEEWGGAGADYVSHLLAHGRVVVGVSGGSVVGFGAARQIGRGPGAVSMLCDLFVDPLELAWTGVDRSADHLAWERRPGGAGLNGHISFRGPGTTGMAVGPVSAGIS